MEKIKRNISGPPVNKSFPQEFIYGLKAFVLTGFLIFAIQLFRGTGQSEGPDKIIYLGSIALAGVFLLMGLVRDNFIKGKYFYSISAFVLTVLGVVGIEEHDPINGVVKLVLSYKIIPTNGTVNPGCAYTKLVVVALAQAKAEVPLAPLSI
jgi:hypothetical protein